MGILVGAIGLAFVVAFVGSWIGGDAAEAGFFAAVLLGVPALMLLGPVLILAVVVDLAGRRAYPGKPIVASWDVELDGGSHVVSLPASRVSAPSYAWVDGARIPLSWTQTGVTTARTVLDGGTVGGTLSASMDARAVAAEAGLLAVSAVLGAPVGSAPAARYGLRVEGAAVEAIPIADGQRRS